MAKHAKHASDVKSDELSSEFDENASADFLADDIEPDNERAVFGAHSAEALEVVPVTSEAAGNNAPEAVVNIPAHQKKSRRMRVVLLVVSVILVLLMAALAYFAFMLVNEARDVATKTAAQSSQVADGEGTLSESRSAVSHVSAPMLVGLLGMTQDEAVAQLGNGATVASSKEITEETGEGDDKKTEVVGASVTIALTDESTDAGGNTPSVYLTLDKDGKITEAGYSTSVKALGYGDVSFASLVSDDHVVENTLEDAGVYVDEGSVTMPENESDYRTKTEDGVITLEQYTFSGEGAATDGVAHAWSLRLSYDYSAANVSNNLADTIKTIYVSIKA